MEQEMNLNELQQIRRQKLQQLCETAYNPYEVLRFERTNYSTDILNNFESMEGKEVAVAGRIMSIRGHGKASFVDLKDQEGKIQVYFRINDVGEEKYAIFKLLDIGDIIGVRGEVFKTHKGEISVKAHDFVVMAKAIQILPEKWHGLKDIELRYRQRYVDLIVNDESRKNFIIRSKLISRMRHYLDARGFMEVETPILQTIPGGAAARPFITHHNALDIDMYLRIATELYLKRLIIGGFDKVYEIGKQFRNEGIDVKHNPEFTTIELYQAYTDLDGMMELTENMIKTLAKEVLGTDVLLYQGIEIDLAKPWTKMTMREAVLKYAGVDFDDIQTDEEARELAKQRGLEFDDNATKGQILNLFFEEFAEENLIQPTFITEYPIEVSPLAKKIPDKQGFTYRFELFIFKMEIANAFSELNDPFDQRERFEKQVKAREAGDEEAHRMDEDFLTAMEYGMPPTGGLGIGIDRLAMLFSNSYSIRDVILFPTMRPKDVKQTNEGRESDQSQK
ncbi:lysyl-tRNA synthetase, class II [Caldanaerobius fijiensis DSM 17918]|uniref:Lysine--tRNA ligase n=1 Tax=Caldanaerobius fijiensis DSM 17918 TaxID=1121256 RepID=A0A1M5AJW7_9THEO|nr:lysine--tRNA ligase [Caldanaerobius fijiensis]SHF30590.1 lysyl-tRNA synthetase, class II [Caldanaerobius fijiensis DSM 17918]